jgi:riboflavin kinase / FMN adenylyltransferase
MEILHKLADAPGVLTGPTVITLGNFDGVHLGHQHLLRQVLEKAKEFKALAGVVTFDPHPVKVLHNQKNLKEILRLEDVLSRFEWLGLDFAVVQRFDRAFADLSPREFVERLLPLKMKHIVIGHDFNFGKDRIGKKSDLEKLGKEYGFTVTQVEAFSWQSQVVSSSAIRECLASGEITRANMLLGGMPFAIHGKVVKGHARGRQIGFPTANISTDAEIVPRTGVYITQISVNNKSYGAATNVGYNPTFAAKRGEASAMTIESHILNFNDEIYGLDVRLEFLARLRDELKFASVEDLVSQIKQDIQKTSEFFERH